jgi:DNA-binding NtrC family response regulator
VARGKLTDIFSPPYRVAVYGAATEYAELVPRAPNLQCVFHKAGGSSSLPPEVDLVVLDLDFVGEHSSEMLTDIVDRTPQPAVLAVTRQPTADSAVQALTGGASDYFALPDDRGRLTAAITDLHAGWSKSVRSASGADSFTVAVPTGGLRFDEYEKRIIAFALERNDWNRTAAARELGISRPRLKRKIEKYDLSRS